MNTKEKTKYFLTRISPLMYCYSGSGMLSNNYDEAVVLNNSKECLKILITEILNDFSNDSFKNYLEQILEESNNLSPIDFI